MFKIFPIIGVIILVISGFGAIALPLEKHIVENPIDIDDWLLEIKIKGGFFGYIITVENIGTEQICGDLDISIETNSSFMVLGEELIFTVENLTIASDEYKTYKMRPIIGYGPTAIYISLFFKVKYGAGYGITTQSYGYLYLFYVKLPVLTFTIPF